MMPSRKENFTNSQEVATKVDNVFKKNFDLDYIDAREEGNISELSKILTNRIAPIMDSSKGRKQKRSAIVQDVPKRLTNRIPDDKRNTFFNNANAMTGVRMLYENAVYHIEIHQN